MNIKYIIITPARNEEIYIQSTIESVVSQTIKPESWIIVDDNSTDRTREIIDRARIIQPWIKLIKCSATTERAPGAKVITLFNMGYESIKDDYDFIIKLDADVSFSSEYFEKIFDEFERDPTLGIAGGYCQYKDGENLKIEWTPEYHVRGATKVYRKKCFREIGGLIPVMGWDGLDVMKAQMLGWKTRSLKNIFISHLRPTGKATGSIRFAWLWGKSSYFMGYDPLFFIIRCLKNMNRHPYLIFSGTMFLGFLHSVVTCESQLKEKELIKFIRNFQRTRLLSIFKLQTYFINR